MKLARLSGLILACALAASAQAAPRRPLPEAIRADLLADTTPADAAQVRVKHAFFDLNGDGRDEVLVYAVGGPFCGSGGCNLDVYEATAHGFRPRAHVTISREPIGVVGARIDGWRSLSVYASGGGFRGDQVVLPFRKARGRYAQNPTTPPARPLRSGERLTVLISERDKGAPLSAPTRK